MSPLDKIYRFDLEVETPSGKSFRIGFAHRDIKDASLDPRDFTSDPMYQMFGSVLTASQKEYEIKRRRRYIIDEIAAALAERVVSELEKLDTKNGYSTP